MALFKILRGAKSNLGASNNLTAKTTDGYAYFTPEDGRFYIDIEDDKTPQIGNSSADNSNRICINNGSIEFSNLMILDCGTATYNIGEIVVPTPVPPPVSVVTQFNSGAANTVYPENTIVMRCGSAIAEVENTIIYNCGNSENKAM